MAAIVGVHGIGKYRYYRDAGNSAGGAAEAMRIKWDRYLGAGLGGGVRPYIAEVAYFAHHLVDSPGGSAGLRKDPARAVATMGPPAQQVFAAWAREVGFGEPITGALKKFTGWVLERLDGRAADFAALFAPEVAAYLTDQARRERCWFEVAEVIRRRKARVVIAHSLGSVVAYEALWANPDLDVELLITLGSPLGMRNVVFEHLLPTPINGRGERPKGVRHWVNISDKDDIAAIPGTLLDSFVGVDQEMRVNLDWLDFHTAEKYLGCGAINAPLQPYL